ncbi:hypothetical protein DXG03_000894 [Asterophora parasitica]|uniref:Uncharacterized protein n=1 Tax=Asterophora parasitica TaxID=117018 RepID=A0A9P7GA57_9AGAR|nr:hypothetical protein DXG03_000894 [Asterophora parasitica]
MSSIAPLVDPPGWYPTATVDGTTKFSTFAQYYTGVDTDGVSYTVGDTVTPSAPYFTPSSSNCQTTATINNGVALQELGITSISSGSGATASVPKATETSSNSGSSTAAHSGAGVNAQASQMYPIITFIAVLSGVAAIAFFH